MPAQETSHNMPILIDEKIFLKVEHAPNKEKFHNSLRSLMTRANKIYNNVFKSDRSEHVKSFPLCKKNYIRIQAIIKNSKFFINFFNVYHLEAELACIQSDFNALNYNVTSEIDLNSLIENLKKIELKFKEFNNDFNNLNSKENIVPETNDVYEKLLIYRNDFSNSWNENSNRLLGDTHYIFSEHLEKTSLQKAINYSKEAANFYNKAGLLMFEDQTIQRIKELEITLKELLDSSHNKNTAENLPNPTVVLTKLPISYEKPQTQVNKRKSADTTSSSPAKERRGNEQIDFKKLLAKLKQIKIENYKLQDPSNKNELIRYKASLASNYALDRIEIFANKKLSDAEKLYPLKEAQNGFSYSIKFYNQAGLIKENDKIIQCYNILALAIDSLELIVSDNKLPPIEKLIAPSNKKSSQKPNNGHSHQPTRYTRSFFQQLSSPENDVQEDNQPSCDKPIYSS